MQIPTSKVAALARSLKRVRGIQAAYLFGSQARRAAARRSDVDIAILVDPQLSPAARTQVDLAAFQAASQTLGRNDIDLVELQRSSPLLRYEAVVRGRPLFVRPQLAHRAIRFQTLQGFEDFRPYLERHRHALKKQFARL